MGPATASRTHGELKYTPCDAGKEQRFWPCATSWSFERNVIVQVTRHGADNGALLDALENAGDRARGVATVKADVTDEELHALHAAGVRGVRFNFVKRLVDALPFDALMSIAERIEAFGWHIVIYFEAAELASLYDFFMSLPTTVVVDHMGRPDVTKPLDGPEVPTLRAIAR